MRRVSFTPPGTPVVEEVAWYTYRGGGGERERLSGVGGMDVRLGRVTLPYSPSLSLLVLCTSRESSVVVPYSPSLFLN